MAKTINNEFFLMHKDILVAHFSIIGDNKLTNISYNQNAKNHLPLGASMNTIKFHEWWNNRAIPKTRHGIKTVLAKLNKPSTNSAMIDNLALSLTDCYWIKPVDDNDLKWEDVNLYTNNFIDNFGQISSFELNKENLKNKTKFSPATSQGELVKKWCVDSKGRRCLIKGNYGFSYQQSINEVFATNLHKQLGFTNFTSYELIDIKTSDGKDAKGVMSYNFCNQNVEFVSANELIETVKHSNTGSLFNVFKDVCLNIGIPEDDFHNYMDYLIMTDYLLTNIDRHMNNIGIIRNPDTLEILGFAPIFDTGNSMFFDQNLEQLRTLKTNEIKVNSFEEKEIKLLKHVRNRNIIDLSKINPDWSIYENDIIENRIKLDEIKRLFENKLNTLKSFQAGKNVWSYTYRKKG